MSGAIPNIELLVFLEEELPGWLEQCDPALQARLEPSRDLAAVDLINRQRWLEDVVARGQAAFPAVDVLVAPTLCVTPPIIDPPPPATNAPPIILARNTCPANFFVQCAISLPVGLDGENMPVGLQFTAPGGAEERLLRAAVAAERVLGTCAERLGTPPMLR